MKELSDVLTELKDLKSNGKLIIFVGSGISVPAPSNLPTWDGFLDEFIDFCKKISTQYSSFHTGFTTDLFDDARIQKSKTPIEVASVLKQKLLLLDKRIQKKVFNKFTSWFVTQFNVPYNNLHESIIKCQFPYILTTNYDMLLEEAADNLGIYYESLSFHENPDLAEAIYSNTNSILHIHGKSIDAISDVKNIVFTQEDYLRLIKKQYPGFSFVMNSLFLKYSTLFVGYGASDPHLEDLVEEFAQYINYSNDYDLPKNYLVLRKNKVTSIKDEYKKRIGTEIVAIKDFDEYEVLFNGLIS